MGARPQPSEVEILGVLARAAASGRRARLVGWVLGYGGEAEIVGPPDVRARFEARVDELARMCA